MTLAPFHYQRSTDTATSLSRSDPRIVLISESNRVCQEISISLLEGSKDRNPRLGTQGQMKFSRRRKDSPRWGELRREALVTCSWNEDWGSSCGKLALRKIATPWGPKDRVKVRQALKTKTNDTLDRNLLPLCYVGSGANFRHDDGRVTGWSAVVEHCLSRIPSVGSGRATVP